MRKIINSTLFLYGVIITCSAFLIGVFVPETIWKYVFLLICGICIGNIIYSLVWGEKQ